MKQNNLEIRTLEIRALEEDLVIEGLINNFQSSKMMFHIEHEEFQEIIPKETWDDAILNNKENIRLHMNHLNGVNIAETLDIWTNENGVYFKAKLIPQARTLYMKIKENIDIEGISIGFVCLEDKWFKYPSHSVREVLKMELQEISILDNIEPAYKNTEVNISKGGVIDDTRDDSSNISNSNDDNTTILSEELELSQEIELLQEEVNLLLYEIDNELNYIE